MNAWSSPRPSSSSSSFRYRITNSHPRPGQAKSLEDLYVVRVRSTGSTTAQRSLPSQEMSYRSHWTISEPNDIQTALGRVSGAMQTKKSKDARSYAPPNTSSQGVTGARGRRSNARTPRCPPPPTRPARRQRRAQAPSAMSSSSAFFSSSSSSSSGNWKLPRSR